MVFFETFDTLQNFASTINKREINEVFKYCKTPTSQIKGHAESLGTDSYNEADGLLNLGDGSNLTKLKNVNIKDVMHTNDYAKNMLKVEKQVCGCLPNIPLYLIGAPNNMLNFKRTPVKSKVLNLVINTSISCDVSGDDIITAGSNVASIVKELEKNGIRVNLYVSCFSSAGNDFVGMLVNIKKSSSPLNMLNIAYPLINPSMVRRHFLRYIETCPVKISSRYVKGYGRPVLFQDMLKQEPKLNRFKDSVIIDIQKMIGVSVSDMVKTISEKTK